MKIIITCEHGGNKIPKEYQALFDQSLNTLATHEGYDIGALKLAKRFAEKFADYFFYTEISRLLVELNRSLHHPHLFSRFTRPLNKEKRKCLLDTYYYPYRNQVTQVIKNEIKKGENILHLSVHSFTPVFKGEVRQIDVGLLYDPKRTNEKSLAAQWKQQICLLDHIKARSNAPYLGVSDGFVTYLRKLFPSEQYVGMELEVNQKFFADTKQYTKVKNLLLTSFSNIINDD